MRSDRLFSSRTWIKKQRESQTVRRWHGQCTEEDVHSPQAEVQLAMIRAEIQRYGQSILSCDKLLIFVARHAPIRSQFDHIFAIAEQENWSLEFRPDGKVRFANIRSRDGQTAVREGRNTDVVEPAEELTPRASARSLR